MHDDSKAAIIQNDIDTLMHKLSDLPANEHVKEAHNCLAQARAAVARGRGEFRFNRTREKFASPKDAEGSVDGVPMVTRGSGRVARRFAGDQEEKFGVGGRHG